MPVTAIAVGEGIKALIGFITSSSQKKQADRLQANNPRPTEVVPQGVLDSTALMRLMSTLGMPAEQYNAAMNNIRRNQATAVNQAQSRRSGNALISSIQTASNDATLNLDAQSAAQRVQNQRAYATQLNNLGQWQDKIWQWNSAQLYLENAAAIRALRGSSAANLNSAGDAIATAGLQIGTSLAGFNPSGTPQSQSSGGQSSGLTSIPANYSDYLSQSSSSNATYADPTITNPDLYSNGNPGGITNYLRSRASFLSNPNL